MDKACFEHDIAFGNFKDLSRRAVSNKLLHDKAFNIAQNQKYDGYQLGIASMEQNCLIKSLLHLMLIHMVVLLKMKLCQINNYKKSSAKQFWKTKSVFILYGQYLGCWSII